MVAPVPSAVPAPAERVYVFIDGSNLYKGMQAHIGAGPFPPASIHGLAHKLAGARRLVKILYYNSPLMRTDAGYPGQQRFFAGLEKVTYCQIKLGRLAKRSVSIYCQTCKASFIDANCKQCAKALPLLKYSDKGTDVNIATDLLINAFDDQYDTAILISEDGDFSSAIQEVQRLKKKVENAFFRKRVLAQVCNSFTLLDAPMINGLRPSANP